MTCSPSRSRGRLRKAPAHNTQHLTAVSKRRQPASSHTDMNGDDVQPPPLRPADVIEEGGYVVLEQQNEKNSIVLVKRKACVLISGPAARVVHASSHAYSLMLHIHRTGRRGWARTPSPWRPSSERHMAASSLCVPPKIYPMCVTTH